MTIALTPDTLDSFTWGDDDLRLTFRLDDNGRIRLTGLVPGRGDAAGFERALPPVEIVTITRSKLSGSRYDGTDLGADLRYVTHRTDSENGRLVLHLELQDPAYPLIATVRYAITPGSGVLSSSVRITHAGGPEPIGLLFVSSFALGDSSWCTDDTVIHLADSAWLAEGRWRHGTFAELGQPEIDMAAHGGGSPRGRLAQVGRGTWSTGEHVPMGALQAPDGGTLLWQVESNGGWQWQLTQSPGVTATGVLRLVTAGPADVENGWSMTLDEGDSFETPVTTVAWGERGFEDAVARLTDHRRRDRRVFAGDAGLPVIYNDYMDTLMADPTTEKLLPLIETVSTIGAEIFVVDAGWYSNEPGWWDTVGEWEASTTRFPGGFTEVFDAIRTGGMIPGLWLEPEVVGIHSPAADRLPDTAFFGRHGRRLVENGRYQLDYRHPEVVARMDAVIDRLVADYSIGYFKFDYNINPASGTDHLAASPGQGLLDSARAYLDWIDGLRLRHPRLLIENCASGGMRGDWLSVSRFALMSTSDQQDPLRCVPIGVTAPLLVPPEQAGVWSYPQAAMSDAEADVTLANSVLRRPILSGHLDHLDEAQLERVRSFVAAHKRVRKTLGTLHSTWPLGLPGWEDSWLATGLVGTDEAYLALWRRDGASPSTITVPLDRLRGGFGETGLPTVEQIFPTATRAVWRLSDDALEVELGAPGAVVLRWGR